MGDYFTVKNSSDKTGYDSLCKLGTCSDWRYTRRQEAEYLARFDAGFNANIPSALGCRETLYRFPFPWEDYTLSSVQAVCAQINKRDMFKTVILPVTLKIITEARHQPITLPHAWPTGGGQFNYFVPCPFSAEFKQAFESGSIKTSMGVAPTLALIGEVYDPVTHYATTIFGCCYCNVWYSLSKAELDTLRPLVAAYYTDDRATLYQTIALRLAAAEETLCKPR